MQEKIIPATETLGLSKDGGDVDFQMSFLFTTFLRYVIVKSALIDSYVGNKQ